MTHKLDLTQNERDFLINRLRNRKDDVKQFNGMHDIHKFTILRKLEVTTTPVVQYIDTPHSIDEMFAEAIAAKNKAVSATLDMLDRWGR